MLSTRVSYVQIRCSFQHQAFLYSKKELSTICLRHQIFLFSTFRLSALPTNVSHLFLHKSEFPTSEQIVFSTMKLRFSAVDTQLRIVCFMNKRISCMIQYFILHFSVCYIALFLGLDSAHWNICNSLPIFHFRHDCDNQNNV